MPNKEEQEKTKVYNFDELTDYGKEENQENQIFEMPTAPQKEAEILDAEHPNMDFFLTPQEQLPEKEKKQKKKGKIKEWWQKRNKKQKILLITLAILFIIAMGVGIFFVMNMRKKELLVNPPIDVIVEEENYRYENGVLIFLNSNKEEIGRYTCKNQNEELCFVSFYSTEDDFDTEKKMHENASLIKTRSAILANNYVFINDNARIEDTTISLYNITEEKVEEVYTLVKRVGTKNDIILKNTENKYGMLALEESGITPRIAFSFDYLGAIENKDNLLVAIENNRSMIVDETGKNSSKAINGTIKNANKTYIAAKQNTGVYEVYNYNNQNVFNDSFEYVELYDDYAVLIKENKMYLKFYDKNKLNEEGIPLANKDYVKTTIYNEEGRALETKEAYSIEESNNTLTIKVYNNGETSDTIINKLEGAISKNLKNINYFDGKLYIYKDASKTDLLGTYTCANKNTIKDNITTLNNCTLAKDTVFEDNDYEIPGSIGVIPVLNERFIFISDNPDLVNDSNKTIVLYDLKKGSSLGKYREVNTYSYTGTDEITFSTVNELKVVAKNQSGNFGVIKIGLSEVSGHISFNYSEMESLRDYYVAKDANGYLLIAKSNGASITSAIPYKIRNYNDEYVKVMNNGNYYIYDLKGKQITSDAFKYIELYNHFFVGVTNSNKLQLFTYKSPQKNELNPNDIQLSLTKYYGNGTLAFKINENGYRYEVLMGTEANNYVSVTTGEIEAEDER